MKKSLLAFTLTAAALTAPFVGAPTSASADDSIATATFTDGVLNINYPSKYAGRTVSVGDSHFFYGSVKLNSNGDATKDFKTAATFRSEAPDRVELDFEGFANPVARSTNLVKEINGNRLMFKQQYNNMSDVFLDSSEIDAWGMGLAIEMKQSDSLTRSAERYEIYYDESLGQDGIYAFFAQSTAPTLSGTSYPVKAYATPWGLHDDAMTGYTYELPFIFDNKKYPAIVLR